MNDAETPPRGAAPTSPPWALERRVALVVAALTLAGLLLRVRGITDSYFGDELYSVDVLADDEWDPVRRGQTMFVVTPRAAGRYATPPPPRGLRVRVVRRTLFDGFVPVAVIELRRAELPS